MYLESVTLREFRNFVRETVVLSPGLNLFIGKNAQGKTNVIEAVSILTNGRSFRAREHKDTIKWGGLRAEVGAMIKGKVGNDEIVVAIDEGSKKIFKNGKKTSMGAFKGLSAVLFAPEEIVILRDSPQARRRYIDTIISHVDDTHSASVKKYEKIVSHRNRVIQDALAGGAVRNDILAPWDEQLAAFGAKVVIGRQKWSERVNRVLPKEYSMISSSDGDAEFKYVPHCGREQIADGESAVKDVMLKEIERRSQDEMSRGITLVGPHRDDFEARVGGMSLKHFGSQGQHRTFVLSLKMAEAELYRAETGEEPILLFDDVASELDEDRNSFLFRHVRDAKGQVFITATDANDIRIESNAGIAKFTVTGGRVTRG